MTYHAAEDRYTKMPYRRCGVSGLKLPAISLGLWQNFGATRDIASASEILEYAFDNGVTHFDLANNYGPPPGSSEELFGTILAERFKPYRDEMIISSKAGYDMWPGPYGEWGSRKYLIASCDQSLKRVGVDYFDIFYSHRFDPNTPLEETMGALASIWQQGKALYVGISNYPEAQTRAALAILKDLGVPLTIHQPSYSILNRWIENDRTIDACGELGVGMIAFSPLAQGVLSGKYSKQAGELTRRGQAASTVGDRMVAPNILTAVAQLEELAKARGQTMVQLALSWVLRRSEITSALIGVRNLEQLKDNLGAVQNLSWSDEEKQVVDQATADAQLDQYPLPR